ncbi:protein kinase domain-containing protein [Streptomyces sp. SD11]|uniref:protein kinase domain-containing protein n=1 Tax=Streptomyces sp. SD11 TaxID=3452209 RepID=UPI003F88A8DC
MEDYAGRVLADRYRLPLPPTDEYELAESRAWDTYSGQEVLVRQVPLPEVVEAEVLDADGLPDGFVARDTGVRRPSARTTRRPTEPAVRRAIEAAQAAAQIPDHPRLDQVFDVFAEGGSLWIVSELVPARQLAALLAEGPLSPYRAAEVASDVLTALRVLHAHGWVHRNITARTVLVCDDGRVMLTGLASGAAEEALCGYDPVPAAEGEAGTGRQGGPATAGDPAGRPGQAGRSGPTGAGGPSGQVARAGGAAGQLGRSGTPGRSVGQAVPGARGPDGGRAAVEAVRGGTGALPVPQAHAPVQTQAQAQLQAQAQNQAQGRTPSQAHASDMAQRALDAGGDVRAARAGAIAAYRAGARAAARVQEEQRGGGNAALPAPRSLPGGSDPESGQTSGPISGRIAGQGVEHTSPPGQIADPYGVGGAGLPGAWHGAAPRGGAPAVGNPGQVRPPALSDGRDSGHGGNGNSGHGGNGGHGGGGIGGTADSRATEAAAYGAGYAPSADHTSAAPGTGAEPGAGTGAGAGTGGAPTQWSQLTSAAATRRGPATALAAERARQARMAVVGPVTERWAPEQAGPVHENWQLAAPIGPATDLWALGALLFRAVQGHAPYPEESTAELVQLVCAEPPAFAEECGPLRPVVESLLRQDPTERLDFEELRGWLRSLVRSAPEPEAGTFVIAAPPMDPTRLPVVRRRGELVRRRRAGLPATTPHGRHKRGKQGREAKPRRLGRTLLLLILLVMAAAVAYAMAFMPRTDSDGERTGSAGDVVAPTPGHSGDTGAGSDGNASSDPQGEKSPSDKGSPTRSSSSTTQTTGPELPQGFTLRKDSEGFRVAVANGWERTGKNGRGQVVYSHGKFELLVVPGRDTTEEFGSDPMSYQREDERELQPFRDSTWATSSGMRRIDVGGRAMAEGQFTWQDSTGSEVYVRNLVVIAGGKYHVVQLRGPEAERDEVTRLYEQASSTYQITN